MFVRSSKHRHRLCRRDKDMIPKSHWWDETACITLPRGRQDRAVGALLDATYLIDGAYLGVLHDMR